MNSTDKFDSKEYARSRNGYTAFSAFEYLISLLVTDAFLAKLLVYIGIDDALIGIISSIISLAFVVQFFSILLSRLRINTKKMIIIFDSICELMFMSLYIVPFLPLGNTIKLTVMLLIIFAYVFKYLVQNILFRWANSYVSPSGRAVFSAKKEIISLISGIIFTTAVSFVFDKFETGGNISDGFLLIAILILILTILNLISLFMIKKEEKEEISEDKKAFSDILKNTVLKKEFFPIILLSVLWYMAQYFTIGFLGTFKTGDLVISLFLIQIFNMLANLSRMFAAIPFGKFSDKKGYASGMALALLVAALGFLFLMFTTKTTWYFVIIYTVLYAVSLAGIQQNTFNITYNYIDKDYISEALSIKNGIAGLCGFLASIIGSRILTYVQGQGNTFLGIPLFGQQLLALISFILTVFCILLIKLVIEKRMSKER